MRKTMISILLGCATIITAQSTSTGPVLTYQGPPVTSECKTLVDGNSYTTLVHADIDTDGLPEKVGIDKSSGDSCYDATAVEAVKKYTFRPATRDGKPIATHIRLSVKINITHKSQTQN